MSGSSAIDSSHPLWKELRNGLLWHRTSKGEYYQIKTDGAIKPNDGRVNRWGGPYACQQLGGVSLFDFATRSEAEVLGEAIKWQQFLGSFSPVTILLGLERTKLPGKLTPYPDNKVGTTGNVIPWVEVCHCGPIPFAAIASYLLVCAVDYRQFRRFEVLDDDSLMRMEAEFGALVQVVNQERAGMMEKIREFNAQLKRNRQGRKEETHLE